MRSGGVGGALGASPDPACSGYKSLKRDFAPSSPNTHSNQVGSPPSSKPFKPGPSASTGGALRVGGDGMYILFGDDTGGPSQASQARDGIKADFKSEARKQTLTCALQLLVWFLVLRGSKFKKLHYPPLF